MSVGPTAGTRAWLLHLLPPLWLFGGALFGGQLLYFRDLSSHSLPQYEFLSRCLQQGVWPLWNPGVDGGGPWPPPYPVDLLLLALGGARFALAVGPPLHLFLALTGGTALARRLGLGGWAAWTAGTVYGLGGFSLSTVNLLPLFQAVAWAPWVLTAFLGLLARPSWNAVARLALVASLQVSTLAGDFVAQTALAGLFLLPDWGWLRDRRTLLLAVAGALALLLSAPLLFAMGTLLEGTARGLGFSAAEALQYSASPCVLAEAVLPRLFGDVHSFSEVGYWGQALFSQGYPYLLSLYVGPVVLLLASRAHLERLHALAFLGLLLSLGGEGPFGALLAHGLAWFRFPVKFFFLPSLAAALLAGRGLDRALAEPPPRRWGLLLIPGLALLLASAVLAVAPERILPGLARALPVLSNPETRLVAEGVWRSAWLTTGALAVAAGLALTRGRRLARVAALIAVADLLIVNRSLNPLTEAAFYDLRPAMAAVVREARQEGQFRWFSYGVANSPGLHWNPAVALTGADVWLYKMDRQSLLPRTHVLDGLQGIFDVDRTGWAPPGSTLPGWELSPAFFRRHHPLLRRANVRWVVSFHELAEDLVFLRATVRFPEVAEPLRVYEIRDPMPRAFWVPRYQVVADPERLRALVTAPSFEPRDEVLLETTPAWGGDSRGAGSSPSAVSYEPIDAQTVRIRAATPPGLIVVLDYYQRYWRVTEGDEPTPLLRANGRYWAIATPGGEREWVARYAPPWRLPSLLFALAGAATVIALTLGPRLPRAP